MHTFPAQRDPAARRLAHKIRKLEGQLARLDPQRDAARHTLLQDELDLTRAALVSFTEFLAERPRPLPARSSRTAVTAALLGLAAFIGLYLLSTHA